MTEIRAFIAIPLNESVRAELVRVQEQLQDALGGRMVRWVAGPNIHLTLKFLGNVSVDHLPALQARLERTAELFAPVQLAAHGLGCFPDLKYPRNVWAQLAGDTTRTALLADQIDKELATLGIPRDTRGFTPHLTLGRVKSEASPRERARLGELVSSQTLTVFGVIHATHIELVQSELQPHGPRYTTLVKLPLAVAKK